MVISKPEEEALSLYIQVRYRETSSVHPAQYFQSECYFLKRIDLFCFQNILLQDREGRNYCVACNELDADGNKDDPGENSFKVPQDSRIRNVTKTSNYLFPFLHVMQR